MLTKSSVQHPTTRRAIWEASSRAIKTGITQSVCNKNGLVVMRIGYSKSKRRCWAISPMSTAHLPIIVTDIAAHAISLGPVSG